MGFGDAQVANFVAVGSVDATSARIWFRAERPGPYVVEVEKAGGPTHGRAVVEIEPGNSSDNTAALLYPAGPSASPLTPLTRYNFRVLSEDGTLMVGAGQFETAPAGPEATPERFSIGVVSCHQPFNSDGELSPRNLRLLQALPTVFRNHDIKFLLTVGDQIYADLPEEFSLSNMHYLQSRWPTRGAMTAWTLEQIRAAYQERYRICWNQLPWLKLLNSWPNYAILDDHEVLDDWGSDARFATPPYERIVEGARMAYMDYQGARQLGWDGLGPVPTAVDYHFTYGTVATHVFDLRSERQVGPPAQVLSPAQIQRFKSFLAANTSAQVILVVTSVPLVHIPEWVTAAGQSIFGTSVDFPDHWSAPQNQPNRNAVLDLIEQHLSRPETQKQRLIVVGGDVHVGCAFCLRFVGGSRPLFYELSTSAVTNRTKPFEADISVLGPQAFELTPRIANGRLDVSLLPAAQHAPSRNPIGGLNAAVIELQRNGPETLVRLKLFGYGDDHQVNEQFISGWL